jgi:hypothetical protein
MNDKDFFLLQTPVINWVEQFSIRLERQLVTYGNYCQPYIQTNVGVAPLWLQLYIEVTNQLEEYVNLSMYKM